MHRSVLQCWSIAAATLALAAPACLRAQTGAVRGVHDPAIIKQDSTYYVFTTGRGIPVRRSTDLVHWTMAGRVFPAGLPEWAQAAVPGTRFPWAPDISFFDGRYHLYYALSTFGKNGSVIGLATNATLDPAAPDYRWKDEGRVLESIPGVSPFNAIDPNVAFDEDGRPWLAWGSFWGGIKMRRLDPHTGKLSAEDTTMYSLAARAGVDAKSPSNAQAIEGPFIIRHGGYYWLFASFDLCCRGAESTYNVRVGRADKITGPYADADGVPMTEGGGTVVLSGVGRIRGPGHNAVLMDGGREWFVHHFYDADERGVSKLQIRPLTWKKSGWPVVGEPITPVERGGRQSSDWSYQLSIKQLADSLLRPTTNYRRHIDAETIHG